MVNYIKKDHRKVTLENKAFIEPSIQTKHHFDVKEAIDKALDTLPEIQKSIVLLRDLEGYEYLEIGEILSLTESQVKVYLFRARQKMKEILKDIKMFV